MVPSEATRRSEDVVLTMRRRRAGCVSRWGLAVALVALAVWPAADAAPTQVLQRTKLQPKIFGQGDAMEFLKKYGYLGKGGFNAKGTTGALLAEDTFKDAIKAYQAFSGLPVTGILDAATVQLMRTPRCGVKDVNPAEPAKGRHKRYVLEGSKWWKHALTYRVSQPLAAAYTAPSSGGLGSWLGSWLGLGGGSAGAAKNVRGGGKKLEAAAAEAAVERALGVWAERSGLTFAPAPAPAKGGAAPAPVDLDVRFERGAHGHCDDFDGRGGTLAHAYYPRFGGDAHFDADEHWTLEEYRGTNFFQVAVHEFGHSLGLRHSDDPDAVMAPVYRGYDPYFELHQDDIDAIQDLYGAPSHSPMQMAEQTQQQQQEDDEEEEEQGKEDEDEETDQGKRSGEEEGGNKGQEDKGEDGNESEDGDGKEDRKEESEEVNEDTEEDVDEDEDREKEPDTPTNELCDDPSVDAMFNTPDGDIYVLKGARYYLLGVDGGVAPGYPRPLAERWPGLPAGVDAAFASAAGATYFFKGALYWRYDDAGAGPNLHDGYPRRIQHGLPGAPDAPDAALLRPADGRLYLFKGAEFWQYDRSRNSYTPRALAQWKGVPAGLDAAFFHGGYTYFFKDGLYYRFDDVAFKVDDGSPPFPRSSAAWWFGCKHTARAHELTDK